MDGMDSPLFKWWYSPAREKRTPTLLHFKPTRQHQITLFAKRMKSLLILSLLSAGCFAFPPQPKSKDWLEAELTVLKFPAAPKPSLSSEEVARGCLRSLQLVDVPYESAGLDRIFPFLTWECRGLITGRAKGAQTNLDEFKERAMVSPVLTVFFGANAIRLGEGAVSKGTATRGDIVTFPVTVSGSQASTFLHKSGFLRNSISEEPTESRMVIRVEKQRRPPAAECWLVREIADLQYAKGGLGWSRHEGV